MGRSAEELNDWSCSHHTIHFVNVYVPILCSVNLQLVEYVNRGKEAFFCH